MFLREIPWGTPSSYLINTKLRLKNRGGGREGYKQSFRDLAHEMIRSLPGNFMILLLLFTQFMKGSKRVFWNAPTWFYFRNIMHNTLMLVHRYWTSCELVTGCKLNFYTQTSVGIHSISFSITLSQLMKMPYQILEHDICMRNADMQVSFSLAILLLRLWLYTLCILVCRKPCRCTGILSQEACDPQGHQTWEFATGHKGWFSFFMPLLQPLWWHL